MNYINPEYFNIISEIITNTPLIFFHQMLFRSRYYSKLIVFKNISFLSEIFSNGPKGLLGTKVYPRLLNQCEQYDNVLILLQ